MGYACGILTGGLMVAAETTALAANAPGAEEHVFISGVYPHLCAYNDTDDPGSPGKPRGGAECGIGAIVPWAGSLWMVTYSPHYPEGSADKLFAITADLKLQVRPESIGGTPAGRMVHRESSQLFIGPHAIDANGGVRTIPYSRMRGRHTAVSRHLTDPENRVYYFDMEGRIYEVDVHSLAVKVLFEKPVPGWHGKGAYTGQGRYIIANNGETAAPYRREHLQVPLPDRPGPEDAGVLAEWDGTHWRTIERRQFTEVTGPGGIHGAPDDQSPVWSVGWDRRSILLKLLDRGEWHTFRLPKGTHTYDPRHGWYTEWPRIREIAPGMLMMDMHGMFYDFPQGFRAECTAGIAPMATHLRYIPDFCHWNGRVVLASDETSLMGNPMAGRAQSNLWFGDVDDLYSWGPPSAWGGPWLNDSVTSGGTSDPFLVNGFEQRCLHLAVGMPRDGVSASSSAGKRCADRFTIDEIPDALARLVRVAIDRGDYHVPAPGYAFSVDRDVTVYLAVDNRGRPDPGADWTKTAMALRWGESYEDVIYSRTFPAGTVTVPGRGDAHLPNAYPLPNTAFLKPASSDGAALDISGLPADLGAVAIRPHTPTASTGNRPGGDVTFTIELDEAGDGNWRANEHIRVPDGGYRYRLLPADMKANWLRITTDKTCIATAYLHVSEPGRDRSPDADIFAGLAPAEADVASVVAGLLRPAGHNRSLQFLRLERDEQGRQIETYYEVARDLSFGIPAESRADEVRAVADLTKDFDVDAASVILTHKGTKYRLPKRSQRYDQPFAAGWPRGIRECESERYMANIHGTFYEIPRDDGPPKMKPVATHDRQIIDYCTWQGLLAISGVAVDAPPDGHVFTTANGVGLWFGAIDDIWKLGKPVGVGGPWAESQVEAGIPSDPYLMTNYDRKRVDLWHSSGETVSFAIEVDVDHTGWRDYMTVLVPAGRTVTHTFPEGYGAHWVRLAADRTCSASAIFTYE